MMGDAIKQVRSMRLIPAPHVLRASLEIANGCHLLRSTDKILVVITQLC